MAELGQELTHPASPSEVVLEVGENLTLDLLDLDTTSCLVGRK